MKLMDRIRMAFGIKSELFVSVQQVQQATSGTVAESGLDANVIMAPIQFIQRTFTQASAVVQKKQSGRWSVVEEHAVEDLLAQPNTFYDGDAMTKALLFSLFWDGNGYLLKSRDELRRVTSLWYAPHWLLEPKWPDNGTQFISHYEYRPEGLASGKVEKLAPSDVVHLRLGLDPRNPRKGLSQLKAVVREVTTDEEAASFSANILTNMGVPGGIISPSSSDPKARPSPADVQKMKEYMENFRGNKRGQWLSLGVPTDIKQFGFDPNQLMLGNLRDITEERVCAMLGVPAAVVGFGAGLQQTKVGATMRELVRLARVNCIEPTQTTIARQLTRQLMYEFEVRPTKYRVSYDNSQVSMFGEDENERAERAKTLVEADIITLAKAQEMVGTEVDPSRNIYKSQLQPAQPAPSGAEPGTHEEESDAA